MKQMIGIFSLIALFCGVFSGCGNSGSASDRPTFTYSMSFFQEEFEEAYSHYEKAIQVSTDSSAIVITGQTSSGKIDIELICTGGDTQKAYPFEISGVTDESIILSEDHSLDWIALVDCYEDTEGTFTIAVE